MSERSIKKRLADLRKILLPCPRCGNMPDIVFGFSDHPFPEGHEYISCPTVFVNVPGAPDQSCGVHAQGAVIWNKRPGPAP